jgi:hypothetical protein
MKDRPSRREVSIALVVSSDTMSPAVSDRSANRHSHRICRVQARAQPGAVGTAPKSRTARGGRPGGGCGGWGWWCTIGLLAVVLVVIAASGMVQGVPRAGRRPPKGGDGPGHWPGAVNPASAGTCRGGALRLGGRRQRQAPGRPGLLRIRAAAGPAAWSSVVAAGRCGGPPHEPHPEQLHEAEPLHGLPACLPCPQGIPAAAGTGGPEEGTDVCGGCVNQPGRREQRTTVSD